MKTRIFLIALSLSLSGTALAADSKKAAEPTPKQRQKMAEVHQKMADCLKSSRPLSECHDEMRKSCQSMRAEGGCPMMGEGHGMGMGKDMGMKKEESGEKEE